MFQEVIAEWLERSVPDKGQNPCYGMPFFLTSDVGVRRKENQDRVCAMAISTKSSNDRPQIAVAVADGMGGMRDGGTCADLALSNFFYGLALYKDLSLTERAHEAVSLANKEVYKFAGGKGGATLSAFILDRDCFPVLVNLGDSRVYSYLRGFDVRRLTVDDSMKEAVGGYGDELVQFIGMGEGMHPSIIPLDEGDEFLAITTDGIHSIEKGVFESILKHAEDFKSAADRLTAVARWCGGHDNASLALIDIASAKIKISNDTDPGVRFWDPFGCLSTFWARSDDQLKRKDLGGDKEIVKLARGDEFGDKKSHRGRKAKGYKKYQKGDDKDKREQLVIDIIDSREQGGENENK